MKFNPGQLVVTIGVNDLIATNEEFAKHIMLSLKRHVAGDWEDVCSIAAPVFLDTEMM